MKGKENAEQSLSAHYPRQNQVPARRFSLERDLAERFGVSRTSGDHCTEPPVAEGLLQKLPKKGCFIPNLNYDDARAAFSVAFCLNVRRQDVRHRMHKLKTYWKWERILAATEKLSTQTTSLSFTFRDEDFHHALVQASDNMYFV